MEKIERIIREFCKTNSGQDIIDFNLFKNPEDLHAEYCKNKTLSQFKGEILELLLEELFLGNGYRVERLGESGKDEGCDLLIRYAQDNSIRFVLQAKNWTKHIDRYDILKEHHKFSDNYKKQFDLNNTHFCFVSWCYVKDIKRRLTYGLNIKVWDEEDIIQNLLQSYTSRYPQSPTILLEPYQESAFNNILSFWRDNKRCYVEHATGTGKTYIITRLAQSLVSEIGNRILILSPSNYINDRIYDLLTQYISRKDIAKNLKDNKRISLLTYQYLMYSAAKRGLRGQFTHVIMDEVHRAGAPEWHSRGLLNVIDEKTKVVGLSATMQRYSGGINIENFLGNNCAGKLSLSDAMARGIIPTGDYVYAVLDIKSKVAELSDEVESKYTRDARKRTLLLNQLDAREITDYSIQRIIHKYYSSGGYRKMIAFCEDIEHVLAIQYLLRKTFMRFCRAKPFEINSRRSRKENKNELELFQHGRQKQGEIYLLTAVDMLNEGIDVSGIDSVMLFRRTESPRIYLQQIGRCLRKHGVNNPLIFDCVLNYERVNIKFLQEAKKAFSAYRNSLAEFGFKDIELPKEVTIIDEVESITSIIESIEKRLNLYPTYEEAKQAVHALRITGQKDYRKRYKEDPRLPSNPHLFYKGKGWIDWYSFFGKESPNPYSTYEEAKQAVHNLRITKKEDYQKRYKEDPRLPSHPDEYYEGKGWIDWSNFFGRESPNPYSTYEEAKQAVRNLNITQSEDYQKRYKEDPRLPSDPSIFYRGKGWIDWPNFFGKESPNPYSTYEEAKQAVRNLGINTVTVYKNRYKEDPRLPSDPSIFYEGKGWIDWYSFFGKESPNPYSTYEEAKQAVHNLRITTQKDYNKRYKEDPRLHSNPSGFYKGKGWVDGLNFFGKISPNFYQTYAEAKQAVKGLGITAQGDYRKRHKEDPRLPSHPFEFYEGKGWTDWYNFFGKESPNFYPTYEEAKQAVQRLGITNQGEYQKRYKEDPRLPSTPSEFYKDKGWINLYEFLGIDRRK